MRAWSRCCESARFDSASWIRSSTFCASASAGSWIAVRRATMRRRNCAIWADWVWNCCCRSVTDRSCDTSVPRPARRERAVFTFCVGMRIEHGRSLRAVVDGLRVAAERRRDARRARRRLRELVVGCDAELHRRVGVLQARGAGTEGAAQRPWRPVCRCLRSLPELRSRFSGRRRLDRPCGTVRDRRQLRFPRSASASPSRRSRSRPQP